MALLWILVATAVWSLWCHGFYRQGRFGYTMIRVIAGLALPISFTGIVLFLTG